MLSCSHYLVTTLSLCSTEERGVGGGGSGLVSFAAYSWNIILGLPGFGVVQDVFRNKGPLGAPKTMAQESDLLSFN